MLPFRPMTWEDGKTYSEYYGSCPVKCAEYSFFGLWGWRESVPLELAFEDGLCWIKSDGPKPGVCGPIGDWNAADWVGILRRHFSAGDVLFDVPEAAALGMAEACAVVLEEERDQWEYVHAVKDMTDLKGSAYSHKRNRVRTFMSNYDWEYFPMLPEDFPAVRDFQERWRAERDLSMTLSETESLYDEDMAVHTALDRWEDFPFLGGMIKVDGEIIAYTIAEEIDASMIDIRFEKAFGRYTGSYQAINQMFLKNQCSGYTWVNREEDMGEEGLRNAKMSYNPASFLKKYRVRIVG